MMQSAKHNIRSDKTFCATHISLSLSPMFYWVLQSQISRMVSAFKVLLPNTETEREKEK